MLPTTKLSGPKLLLGVVAIVAVFATFVVAVPALMNFGDERSGAMPQSRFGQTTPRLPRPQHLLFPGVPAF